MIRKWPKMLICSKSQPKCLIQRRNNLVINTRTQHKRIDQNDQRQLLKLTITPSSCVFICLFMRSKKKPNNLKNSECLSNNLKKFRLFQEHSEKFRLFFFRENPFYLFGPLFGINYWHWQNPTPETQLRWLGYKHINNFFRLLGQRQLLCITNKLMHQKVQS